MTGKRGEIYILQSFLVKKGEWKESGKTYWFSKLEDAIEYIDNAGKPSPRGGQFDDPCEYRWGYVVVEKCFEFPYSHNEVMGWWKASYKAGEFLGLTSCEAPIETEGAYNFTGIG